MTQARWHVQLVRYCIDRLLKNSNASYNIMKSLQSRKYAAKGFCRQKLALHMSVTGVIYDKLTFKLVLLDHNCGKLNDTMRHLV